MSFWKYCKSCRAEMHFPSDAEVLQDAYDCRYCGTTNEPGVTLKEIVGRLMERVEALEKNTPEPDPERKRK